MKAKKRKTGAFDDQKWTNPNPTQGYGAYSKIQTTLKTTAAIYRTIRLARRIGGDV